MSTGNLQKGGAVYEAVLVDKVSGPVDSIIKKLTQLETAYDKVNRAAARFHNNLQKGAQIRKVPGAPSAGRGGGLPRPGGGGIGGNTRGTDFLSGLIGGLTARVGPAAAGLTVIVGAAKSLELSMRATGAAVGFATNEMVKAIGVSSDAREIATAFDAVFGQERQQQMRNWIGGLNEAVGRSQAATERMSTSFQAFFVGLGATRDAAMGVSKAMTTLAVDFGSVFNRSDTEAGQRFIAALSGSSEVLDQFGINIRENQLELEAQRLGFGDNVRNMTEYQKALTRAMIISKTMARQDFIGDAVRTHFEWANQVRSLQSQYERLQVAAGGALRVLFAGPLRGAVNLLKEMASWVERNGKGFMEMARSSQVFQNIEAFLNSIAAATKGGDMSKMWETFAIGAELAFLQISRAFGNLVIQMQKQLGQALIQMLKNTANSFIGGGGGGKTSFLSGLFDVQPRIDELQRRLEQLGAGIGGTAGKNAGFDSDAAIGGIDAAVKSEQAVAAWTDKVNKMAKMQADYNKVVAELKESIKTPVEKFRELAVSIDEMLRFGSITQDQARKALTNAGESLPSQTNRAPFQTASIGTTNTNVVRNMSRFGPAFDSQLSESKKQTDILKEIKTNTAGLENLEGLIFN